VGDAGVTSENERMSGGPERHLGIVLLLGCLRLSWMVRWVRYTWNERSMEGGGAWSCLRL